METVEGPLEWVADCNHAFEASIIAAETLTNPKCSAVYVQKLTGAIEFMMSRTEFARVAKCLDPQT
jgi:hypothetical protein